MRGFDIIGICNYCGGKKIVHFDDDLHAEDFGKICNECESVRSKQGDIIDDTINRIMGVTPYTVIQEKELKIELDRLRYVRLQGEDSS